MPLGTEVGIGPGHIVLSGNPARPMERDAAAPFKAHVYCGQMIAHLSNCSALVLQSLAPDIVSLDCYSHV